MTVDKEIQSPSDFEKEGTGGDEEDTKILKKSEKKKSKVSKKPKKKDKYGKVPMNSALPTSHSYLKTVKKNPIPILPQFKAH